MSEGQAQPIGLRADRHCRFCQRGYENHEYNCTGGCAAAFRTRLIGFCGPAFSGKSLAAERLIRKWRFQRVRFAGPLKAMMRALGLTEDQVDGTGKETSSDLLGGMTPRQAMQLLGTEWGRELIHAEIWISAWQHAVDDLHALRQQDDAPVRLVVCDDVRFANEARAIRARSGIVVKIDRPGAGSASGACHASEQLAFEPDITIQNNGTRADFFARIDRIAEMMREGSFDE